MTEVPIIDQTISTVAPVKHRDTINPTIPATQDAFVQSVEAFFDKISDTTVNEINQVTTKIDATVSAINIVSNEIITAATDVEDAKQITIDAKEATIIAKNEAQSIYDNFDDRYLGTKSTPPTVDNDGDPLKQGALYCQESINPEENGLMYVYDILLGDWVNITFVPTLLSSLTDVFFSGLANGDILKYDISIGKWKNIPVDYYTKTETYSKTETDNAYIALSGNQTIADIKTFTSSPIIPTPTAQDNSNKAATTAYVDGKMVLGTAVNSTSGTSIDFTGIPGWAKRITIMFKDVSTNGASGIIIRIGDSGGISNSGYVGGACRIGAANELVSNSFAFADPSSMGTSVALWTVVGTITINNTNSYSWESKAVRTDSVILGQGVGSKTLSSPLDKIRITTVNGTDTFDAGQINIMYEG